MDNQEYVEDQINRYVYQVSRFLVVKNKEDIEKEIRTLIDDMLETRCQGRSASKEDLSAVLTELGKPSSLAAKYNDSKRYLIGPELFPTYFRVVRAVVIIVAAAVLISNLVSLVTGDFLWENLSGIVGAALSAFAMVTIGFAVVEWKGLNIEDIFEETKELPPVPVRKARIPRSDPIVGMIFSLIFIILFLTVPQYFGVWDAGSNEFVSIFNVAVIRSLALLFVIEFTVSFIKEIFRLVEGRYTIRLMVVTILCNAVNLLLMAYILRTFPIWNLNFPDQLMTIFHSMDADGLIELKLSWTYFTQHVFLWIIIFGNVIETLTCVVKTLIYGLDPKEK